MLRVFSLLLLVVALGCSGITVITPTPDAPPTAPTLENSRVVTATHTRLAPVWTASPTGDWDTPTPEAQTVVYLLNDNAYRVNVRSCASTRCEVIAQVQPGAVVSVCWLEPQTSEGFTWYSIADEDAAWVASEFLTVQPAVGRVDQCD